MIYIGRFLPGEVLSAHSEYMAMTVRSKYPVGICGCI